MTMAAFDTVTVAKRLSDEYGFEKEQAEGIAVTMHDRLVDSVATKEDLALLRNGVGSLREDVDRLRKEMKSSEEKGAARIAAEIKASEGRLEAGMQSLEGRLEARMQSLEGRLEARMQASEGRLEARIAAEIKASEGRLEARMQASEGRLEAGMQSLEDKLEARIAVAVGDMHKELLEQMDKRFHRMWMFMIGIVGVAVAALKFLP